MDTNLKDKLPGWLSSLWDMETELRNSARQGLVLNRDEAIRHLGEARRHFEYALASARGEQRLSASASPVPATDIDDRARALFEAEGRASTSWDPPANTDPFAPPAGTHLTESERERYRERARQLLIADLESQR